MTAEFSKDDHGYIWFYYADNIQIRQIKTKNLNKKDAKNEAKKVAENKEKVRKTMIEEL